MVRAQESLVGQDREFDREAAVAVGSAGGRRRDGGPRAGTSCASCGSREGRGDFGSTDVARTTSVARPRREGLRCHSVINPSTSESGHPHHLLDAFISTGGSLSRHENGAASFAPDAPTRLSSFMKDRVDYVFVGHSQGTDILMHVLNQVCTKNGIAANTDGEPK